MATIKIDAETMRSKATEISGLRDQHDQLIASIGSIINGMSGVFEGAAATAYVTQYDSMKATFTQFSEMLMKFSTELNGVANTMENTDTSLAGSISSAT